MAPGLPSVFFILLSPMSSFHLFLLLCSFTSFLLYYFPCFFCLASFFRFLHYFMFLLSFHISFYFVIFGFIYDFQFCFPSLSLSVRPAHFPSLSLTGQITTGLVSLLAVVSVRFVHQLSSVSSTFLAQVTTVSFFLFSCCGVHDVRHRSSHVHNKSVC
uniref:Uncharacterized protein n=1 Tax=Cacopsylla melanoneura TaxID=428564 RepID=A0A8D8W9I6_9HEMI